MALSNSANTPKGNQGSSGKSGQSSPVQKVVDQTAQKVVDVHNSKK